MSIKVINLRGKVVELPDSWAGTTLQKMIAEGYQVIPDKVEIPVIKEIELDQRVKDPTPIELEVVDLEVPEIPDSRLRMIEKGTNKVKRLPGYAKKKSIAQQASRKKKVNNG